MNQALFSYSVIVIAYLLRKMMRKIEISYKNIKITKYELLVINEFYIPESNKENTFSG